MTATGTPLWRSLLSVGDGAARRSESAKLRFVALILSTFFLVMALATMAVIHAAYSGKEDRRAARTPVWQADRSKATDSTLWLVGSDSLQEQRRFSVVYLTPDKGDAPLPPGVTTWPGPGEAVLSPALLRAGADEGIEERYGQLAGTIHPAGLEDPGEWLAYVRPSEPLVAERPIEAVSGFGPESGRIATGLEPGSADDDDKPQWMLQALAGGLLLIPAVTFVFVAVRVGAHTRDRRGALIDVLGGNRRDRAILALGEVARPVLLGVMSTLPVLFVIIQTDVTIPHVNYVLHSGDVGRNGWLLVLALVVAALIVLLMTVATDRMSGRAKGNRARSTPNPRRKKILAALFPAALLLAVFGPDLVPQTAIYRVYLVWIGLVAVALTMPSAVSQIIAWGGLALEGAGRRRGWPAALVAGRRASVFPGAVARLISGVLLALMLFAQSVAWQTIFGTHNAQLEATLKSSDTTVAEIGPKGQVSERQVLALLARIPQESEAVVVDNPPGGTKGPLILHGSCNALRQLQLPCGDIPARVDQIPDSRVREMIRWNSTGGTHVEAAQADRASLARLTADAGEGGTLAIIGTGGKPPSVADLKQLTYEIFPRGAQVRYPGEEWLTTTIPDKDQGRWVRVFGVTGIAILVFSLGFIGSSEFLRIGRALAPLSVLTGNNQVYRVTSSLLVAAPLCAAGVTGGFVASWMVTPVSRPGSSFEMPPILMLTGVGVVCAIAALMCALAAQLSVRQAREWRTNAKR
ncbi:MULTISPECIES: hypothetical protein [Streptomyces]|uniref:hypothetical protein n=1 Tax=Streptomyces TaxID=1883 RepID=UPI003327E67E